MQHERRISMFVLGEKEEESFLGTGCLRHPFFKILSGRVERLLWCFRLRRCQFATVSLVERNAVLGDFHEKDTSMRPSVVHFVPAVDDEVDRRDRKSVVKVKRGSVRVNLDGRRDIKKTNKK